MAFNFGGGGGDDDDRVMADINVTPLVDVMLVLLIIFMVAAPMLHQGIEVALPRADARNLPLRVEDPLVVSINRDGLVFMRDAPVDPDQLVERLTAQLQGREQDTVFLKGDRDAPYGKIVDVLDILQQGGIKNVGMVTEKRRQGGS